MVWSEYANVEAFQVFFHAPQRRFLLKVINSSQPWTIFAKKLLHRCSTGF